MSVTTIDETDFKSSLQQLSSLGYVVVHFAEPDTPVDAQLSKFFELVARKAAFSRFLRIVADSCSEAFLSARGVLTFPMFHVYQGGKLVKEIDASTREKLFSGLQSAGVVDKSVAFSDFLV